MKKTNVLFGAVLLVFFGMIAFFVGSKLKNTDTINYSKLTNEQQIELTSALNEIMGGQCSISSVKKHRIGGQAQVTYYFITMQSDSVAPVLPMNSDQHGSGYYYENGDIIVRILKDKTKKDMSVIVPCLENIFND